MKTTKKLLVFFASLLMLVQCLVSCETREEKITKEEAMATAKKMEESVAAGRKEYINDLIDVKSFVKKISLGKYNNNQDFADGVVKGLKKNNLGDQIVNSLDKKGSYELVKYYEDKNKAHLVFRLYENGKLNYHDYELTKKGRDVKVADVYIYITGENLSKTFKEAMNSMFPDEDDMDMTNAGLLKDIKRQIESGDYKTALESLEKLPLKFRNEKIVQLYNIRICQELDEETYAKALDEYKSNFPNDPGLPIILIDYYIMKKDYDKSIESINKLDSIINKDPFLDYYRALVYNLKKDKKNALVKLEKLQLNMPHFTSGTAALLVIYLDDKNYDKAVPLFINYKKEKKADKNFIKGLYILYPELKKKVPDTE